MTEVEQTIRQTRLAGHGIKRRDSTANYVCFTSDISEDRQHVRPTMNACGTAAALFAGIALATGCSAKTEASPLIDFLIQDVCTDAQGQPQPGDPASCARHRDAAPGDAISYLLTDLDRPSGQTFQAISSIPVVGSDGGTLILVVKSLQGSFTPDYRFNFDPKRDAFDLIDTGKSRFASIVRTFDGGCGDQVFSHSGSRQTLAERAGGWILFPASADPATWPASQSLRHMTFRMQLADRGLACRDNQALGLTTWARPAATLFESGKQLIAIRSDHFAAEDLSQAENSFERNYFTREYGLTRWEAWQTLAYCEKTLGSGDVRCQPENVANPWHGRCVNLKEKTTQRSGVAIIGNQTWVRVQCRDQTNVIALTSPQLFAADGIAEGNDVDDVDFDATRRGKPRTSP